jgi:hypothetical protein
VGFSATRLRGGAWFNDHINARAVSRNNNNAADRNNNIGFRLVRVVRPTPPSPLQWPCRAGGGRAVPFHQDRRLPGMLAEQALPARAKR